MLRRSDGFLPVLIGDEVENRDDDQGQHGGDKNAENQRDCQTVENWVVQNEKRPQHGCQPGEYDGLRARDGRAHDGALEGDARAHLQLDEVHEQDGVAHDDAGQRNHANHAGGGVLRAQQGVPRHDADDGQRNRRHDDQRGQIRAKMGNYQEVDEHQPHAVGNAHVAEGLIGDLPFAIPFQRVVAPGVRGRVDEVFLQCASIGSDDLRDGLTHLEHAVERAVNRTGHVAGDKIHRQQILVIERRFLRLRIQRDQFADGHGLALRAAHGQLQQGVQIAVALRRQLQHDGNRVFALIMQEGAGIARKRGAQCAHDVLLRDAQQSRLVSVDAQRLFGGGGDGAVIYVDHACGALKDGAHGLGECLSPGFIGAVNFGHDGREHGRPRRDFHHFDVGTKAHAHLLQRWPQPGGNGVTLFAARGFVLQIDLQIPHVGAGAQIVLANQTVKVDGRGGARVCLIVGDFGHACQIGAEFVQDGGGLFQRRAGGHVDDDLKFGFVIEGQHF